MPTVIGVSFKPVSKIYYFDPGTFGDLQEGEYVIVETSQGREVGQVQWNPREMSDEEVGSRLKPVVRRATPLDLVERDRYQHRADEVLEMCQAKAQEHQLTMKVVNAEYSFDGSRLVISFTSEGRVDFRALVRDLARTFSTRIEMKQIGVRDEAKILDGYGKCGRRLCCASWLREFSPVTIKMAKNQNLPLNPPEISGVCGRLLCCLAYEMETYTEARKRLPKVGAVIETPEGRGRVRKVQPLSEIVTVRLEGEDALRDFQVDQLLGGTDEGPAFRRDCSNCDRAARQARGEQDPEETTPQIARDDQASQDSGEIPSQRPRRRRRRRSGNE